MARGGGRRGRGGARVWDCVGGEEQQGRRTREGKGGGELGRVKGGGEWGRRTREENGGGERGRG